MRSARHRRSWTRRAWLAGIGCLLTPGLLHAAPPEGERDRRLAHRIELWSSFARRTDSLVAHYSAQRESSLLREPLTVSGTLAFVAPSTLILRDDDLSGSTTKVGPGLDSVVILPNQASLPARPPIDPAALPAMRWLRDHLLALFAAGDGSSLLADARAIVPRGNTPRLELLPPLDSETRRHLRSLTITLDAVGGAVLVVEITEAQGDRTTLHLSDHRQNPGAEELARVLADPR